MYIVFTTYAHVYTAAADPGGVRWVRTNLPPPSGRVWWLKTLERHGCIKVVQ